MVFAVALLAFASLGLPDGVLGVAWPSMRGSFGLPLGALGALLAATMAGYLASSFAGGWLAARFGVGRLLVWSSALMVANSAAYAFAPAWGLMVAAGVLAGLGAGAIDAGINAYAAAEFSPRRLSWLHAAYGVGATLGPLLMTTVLVSGGTWRLGYGLLGAALTGMALAFVLTRPLWPAPRPGDASRVNPIAARGLLETAGRSAVWLNVALFFVYTGLEATAGQWAYSLFIEARGVAPTTAGVWVAGYWVALTLGRLGAGFLAARWSPATLLRFAMAGAPLAALLLWIGPGAWSSWVGLLALGATLAPIYPLLVAGTPVRVGAAATANAVGFQVAGAYLGAAALPGLAGIVAYRHGLETIGPLLMASALVLLVLHERTARGLTSGLRRRAPAPARG
jgi:fucose permease